jgi:hypothetical protein
MVQSTRSVAQSYIKPADPAGPHGVQAEVAVEVLPKGPLLPDRRTDKRERGGPSREDGQPGRTAQARDAVRERQRDDGRGGGNSHGGETGESRGLSEEYELELPPFAAVADGSETLSYSKNLPVPAGYRSAGVPVPYFGSNREEPNPFLGSEDGVKFGWEDPLRPGVRLPLRFRWVSPLSVENV